MSLILTPLALSPVSCTFSSAMDDTIEQRLSLDEHLIHHPAATFFVRARGDCMAPTILDGDLLIVDKSLVATSHKIVLAVLDGEFTLKRYLEEGFGANKIIQLAPDNPRYNPIVLHAKGVQREFFIWGVVTYVIHKTY